MKTNISESSIELLKAKNSYEEAKQEREKISLVMQELERQIDLFEDEKDELVQKHKKYITTKEQLKQIFKKVLAYTTIGTAVGVIICLFRQDFTPLLFQITFLFGMYSSIQLIPYVIINKKNIYLKKVSLNDLEQLEKYQKDILAQRINYGMEYKNARDKELQTYKIYKELEKSSTEYSYTGYQDINMKDIYYKIKGYPELFSETIANQKTYLDNKLKEYLVNKIMDYYSHIFNINDLIELSTKELVDILITKVPREEHPNTISHIIHTILGFCGNMQGYGVVWFEEPDEALIKNPQVIFDEEGLLIELKTHKNTDYQLIFEKVYYAFLDNVMVNKQNKIKVRNKKSN